jgi:hypothetical protein
LPPGASPSLSVKVSKNLSDCSFKFNINIGIPGGTCTSVAASTTDDGPVTLADGDGFTSVTSVELAKDTSGSCDVYKLTFHTNDYTLDVGAPNLDTDNVGTNPFPGCCTAFDVISQIIGFAPGTDILGLPSINLQYKTMSLKLPQIGINQTGITPNIKVGCASGGLVASQIFLQSTAGCPCADTIEVEYSTLSLDLPEPGAVDSTGGTNPTCCGTVNYIDGTSFGGGGFPIQLVKVGCAYNLKYNTNFFTLPKTSLKPATAPVSASLTGGAVTVVQTLVDDAVSCGCGLTFHPTTVSINTGGVDGGPFPYLKTLSITCTSSSLSYTTTAGMIQAVNGIITVLN